VNKSLINEKLSYSPLLFPFWKPVIKKSTPFTSAVWKRYNFDASYYCLVNEPENADCILLPHRYWLLKRCNPGRLKAFLDDARPLGKPILIDAYGDSDSDVPVDNAYVLRTSQYRFKMKPNEIILPAYVEDLLESYSQDTLDLPRSKTSKPVVGFAGMADLPIKNSIKTSIKSNFFKFLSYFDKNYAFFTPGVAIRKRIINVLSSSQKIETNFLIRKTYSGRTSTMRGDIREIRSQFITNIFDSDYTLTVKGNGNYSQRFYETLSLGRIPLFVDTDCVLPLESIINYKEFCLFVDYKEINRIADIVYEFHNRITPEAFVEMQQKARFAFENYLRVDKLTKHLMKELLDKLNTGSENHKKTR